MVECGKMNAVKQRQRDFDELCKLRGLSPSGKLRILYEAIRENDKEALKQIAEQDRAFYRKHKVMLEVEENDEGNNGI